MNLNTKQVYLVLLKQIMRYTVLFLFLANTFMHAQQKAPFVDNRYLEDQLYINVSYNLLLNTPDPIAQTGFSYTLGLGFIKDLPINERRNIAFGGGLGYGFNNFYFNVRDEVSSASEDTNVLRSNKISLHTVELPLEFRIRTSTAEKYKFWRFYPGFKLSYVFAKNTNLKQRQNFEVEDVVDINKLLYGLTFSAGYNKWNLHVYYGLNSIFNNDSQNSYEFDIHDIRIGLMFYIL